MKKSPIAVAVVFASSLYGCASIIEGTSQTLFVELSPKETTCDVQREGASIARVTGSNPSMNISKSKEDVIFICNAPGHKEQFVKIESSASGWGIVSCFLVDLCITDYSTGALNKYPKTLSISLAPIEGESTSKTETSDEHKKRN